MAGRGGGGKGAGAESRTLGASGRKARTESVSKDLETLLKPSKPIQHGVSKYRNVKTVVDGVTFDSKREAERYAQLRMLEQAGVIHDLFIHEAFPLVVRGEDCGSYVSDFTYLTEAGERVVEDVKSAATRKLPTYRLKRRLLWAVYGLRITEV